MKKITFILLAAFTLSSFSLAEAWKNDKAHSQLAFTVTHLGISDVTGFIRDFDVEVASSKEDFSDAKFTLKARPASIDTRIEARDNHLKSADFFDVEKYPEILFETTSLKKKSGKNYTLQGNLTMHGVTKPVSMNLVYKGSTKNAQSGKTIAGFTLSGTILRSDFGIGPKFPAPMISNEVRIQASGEFAK